MIIAAVVTAFTYGATSEFFAGALGNLGGAIAAGAFSGAVGSTASQAVGVATGIQDKFSWNQVALAAISAGATKGLSRLKLFGGAGAHATEAAQQTHLLNNAPGLIQQAGLAMSVSIITQGIGVATGMQKEFSWAGVAGAGVGAALGGWVGRHVGGNVGAILASSADAIGNAATRSLIEGSDFGDNIIAALPSVIGNAPANGLIGAMTREEELTPVAQIEAETLEPSASLDLSALSAQLPTFERVGSNGSFWKVGERTLPAGASDAQVRARVRVLELMATNPTLDPMHMDANDYVTIPSGAVSVDATTLAKLGPVSSAIAASAITQGIGVATGLQKEFSWAGVAAAGVGAAVGGWVGAKLHGVGETAAKAITGAASAIADAATHSLIDGSDFGDKILAALPSVRRTGMGMRRECCSPFEMSSFCRATTDTENRMSLFPTLSRIAREGHCPIGRTRPLRAVSPKTALGAP